MIDPSQEFRMRRRQLPVILPVSFYLLRFERVDNLGAYRIPPETGILIPSDSANLRIFQFHLEIK
jgi:hypothetical protein